MTDIKPPGASAGRGPYLDTELLCPKCREPNTIGELQERHECKKCGHPSGNQRPFDYPAAARSIALNLAEFCNESLPFPEMIADAARKARSALAAERAAGEDARILARGLDCVRRGLVTTRDGMDWRIACTGGQLSYQTALAAIQGITLDGRLDDDLLDKYLAPAAHALAADRETEE